MLDLSVKEQRQIVGGKPYSYITAYYRNGAFAFRKAYEGKDWDKCVKDCQYYNGLKDSKGRWIYSATISFN